MQRKLLSHGHRAAVCFSIDDIHPGKSTDAYEAGGDLGKGALRHVEWLLNRHHKARVTLFTTPDWRQISPHVTRTLLARVPYVRERVFLSKTLLSGTMRLTRHPEFVRYLRQLPRTEIGLHGLHHIHPGRRMSVEFQKQSTEECTRMLRESRRIFDEAGLPYIPGMTPPGWNLPPSLAEGMARAGLIFVASARDTITETFPNATTNMTGLRGVSLLYPEMIENGALLHFTTNFQATSSFDRAFQIIENGGLLSIKAHIVKQTHGYVALDGMDECYRNYLDVLFTELDRRYGESLWWTSMGELAARWSQLRSEKATLAEPV